MSDAAVVLIDVSVVGSRKDGQGQRHSIVFLILEAFFLDLVTSNNQFKPIFIQKLSGLTDTKIIRALPDMIVLPLVTMTINRVTPKEITKFPLSRHLPKSINLLDLSQRFTVRRDPSMNSEIFMVNDSS